MNKLYKQLLTDRDLATEYENKLKGDKEKSLFKASIRLMIAFVAAPGVSPNRILDHLAKEDDGMKMIKTLIREHHIGIDGISNTFYEYFSLNEKAEFWDFFNQKLNLPDGWQNQQA